MRFFYYLLWAVGAIFMALALPTIAKQKVTPTPIKVVTPTPRTGGLTDEEYELSKHYVHEGYLSREAQELCKGMEDVCRGDQADFKFLGISNDMMKIASRCYSTVVGSMSAAGLMSLQMPKPEGMDDKKDGSSSSSNTSNTSDTAEQVKNTEAQKISEEEAKKRKEYEDNQGKRKDFCSFIAVGTETVATAMETLSNKNVNELPSSEASRQKDEIYKAAIAHEDRAKISLVQLSGWGATTACYAGMLATNFITINAAYIIKQAASAFMVSYFAKEYEVNRLAASKTRAIAARLSGQGDCNPITETLCYCAQPETMNDIKYCAPSIKARMLSDANNYQITCLDSKMRSDPDCHCLMNNSCYDRTLDNMLSALPPGFAKSNMAAIKKIYRGELQGGSAAATINRQSAAAQQILGKYASKLPAVELDPSLEQAAQQFSKAFNVPLEASRFFAGQKDADDKNMLYSRYSGGRGNSNYSGADNASNVYYYGKKNTTNKHQKKDYLADINKQLKNMQQGPAQNTSDGEIIAFGQKAQAKAAINTNQKDDLFKMISRRYQLKAAGLQNK